MASRTQNQPGSPWENWRLPTTSQLNLFALHNLHLGPIWTMELTCAQTVLAPCFSNLNGPTRAIGKTRMVPKPSKFTTAWWLLSNSKSMPLAMKCQVNSEKSQIFQNTTQNWVAFGKLVATYNFATSLFCTTQSPCRTNLDDCIWQLDVPKLYIILRKLPLLQRPGLKWAK